MVEVIQKRYTSAISVPKTMLKKLPQYIQGCHSNQLVTQHKSVEKIRMLLECLKQPPINDIINSGVLHQLLKFLEYDKCDKLRYNTVCILTTIAAGTSENVETLITHGTIPKLLRLLDSQSMLLKTEVMWSLSNIAGDYVKHRNVVLSHNVLTKILPLFVTDIASKQQLEMLRIATWLVSNLCNGNPAPNWKYVQLAIKALKIMIHCDDNEILKQVCWTISYLVNESEQKQMNAIINTGFVGYLIRFLDHSSTDIRHPAVRSIGNIATMRDAYVTYLIHCGISNKLTQLIMDKSAAIRLETCWLISNICAGPMKHIKAIITPKLTAALINVLQNEKYKISKEAFFALCNASNGNCEQVEYLFRESALQILCLWIAKNTKCHSEHIKMRDKAIYNIVSKMKSYPKNLIRYHTNEKLLDSVQLGDKTVHMLAGSAMIIKEYISEETTNSYTINWQEPNVIGYKIFTDPLLRLLAHSFEIIKRDILKEMKKKLPLLHRNFGRGAFVCILSQSTGNIYAYDDIFISNKKLQIIGKHRLTWLPAEILNKCMRRNGIKQRNAYHIKECFVLILLVMLGFNGEKNYFCQYVLPNKYNSIKYQKRFIGRLCENCHKRENREINDIQWFKMCKCKMYNYCSKRCQKLHWIKQHRFTCVRYVG